MNKIREVIRMDELGFGQRQIARALKISRPVIAQYLQDFKATGLTYSDIEAMCDDKLAAILFKKKETSERYQVLSKRFNNMATELKRTGVTLRP